MEVKETVQVKAHRTAAEPEFTQGPSVHGPSLHEQSDKGFPKETILTTGTTFPGNQREFIC